MANQDEQIQKELWNGWIPVVLNLARDEITTPVAPEPYFLLVHRCGYLPIDTSVIINHFHPNSKSSETEMWFSPPDSQEPLKWHVPSGVLYDLYGNRGKDLPWQLTVHFNNFPEGKILHCLNESTIKAHFMNNIKEASHMKKGDTQLINNLSKIQQDDLWEGVKQKKYDTFWRVQSDLIIPPENIKHLPIRILQKNSTTSQVPIKAVKPDGQLTTLGDMLANLYPDIFGENGSHSLLPFIQGITPPMETPLYWLVNHCSHPDNFLYVALV